MRIHLIPLAAALLGATVVGQTHQQMEIYGTQTSFTSRGNLGTTAGELMQGYHGAFWRGIAEDQSNAAPLTKGQITQLAVIHQDQNCSTTETWHFVVRSGDDTNGPTTGTAGEIAVIGPYNLPNSTTQGACAWSQTLTLTAASYVRIPLTPSSASSTDNFFSVGTRLTASPNWVSDGHSQHTTFGSAAYPHQNSWTQYEPNPPSPRTSFPGGHDHAWQIVGTATTANHPSDFRTWRYILGSFGVAGQLGCGDGTAATTGGYGMGGMFPIDSPASAPLALAFRLRGGTAASGQPSVCVIGGAPFGTLPPLPFGTAARWYTSPIGFLVFGPSADATGTAVVPLAPLVPANINSADLILPFQGALGTTSGLPRLSNAQGCQPL